MKSKWLSVLFALVLAGGHLSAQTAGRPFKGRFYNEENRIYLTLDLYEATLSAPGLSFLGKMNGFMHGNIYGIWLLTSHKIEGKTATLRFSNDQGSDAQTVRLIALSDSVLMYKAVDGNSIRRVEKRKLVKIPSEMTFRRK